MTPPTTYDGCERAAKELSGFCIDNRNTPTVIATIARETRAPEMHAALVGLMKAVSTFNGIDEAVLGLQNKQDFFNSEYANLLNAYENAQQALAGRKGGNE